MKIDGGLEARHFLGDSAVVGLITRLGPVDVVLQPRGFEDGVTGPLVTDAAPCRLPCERSKHHGGVAPLGFASGATREPYGSIWL